MRKLILPLGVALLLCGCGNSTSDVSVSNPQPVPVASPATTLNTLQINSANAQSVGQTLLNTVVTDRGALSSLVNSTNTGLPIGLTEGLTAALLQLSSTVGQTLPGPNGGSVTITGSGTSLTAVFTNFAVSNSTFNGTLSANGLPTAANTSFSSAVTLSNFAVTAGGQSFQTNGSINLQRTVNGNSFTSTLTDNSTITSSGGSLQLQNVQIVTNGSFSGSSLSGTRSFNGGLLFQNFQGLTGQSQLSTVTPLSFSSPPSTVSAGQLVLSGTGSLRLTVISPNVLEFAVANPGSTTFTVVNTIDLSSFL